VLPALRARDRLEMRARGRLELREALGLDSEPKGWCQGPEQPLRASYPQQVAQLASPADPEPFA